MDKMWTSVALVQWAGSNCITSRGLSNWTGAPPRGPMRDRAAPAIGMRLADAKR